MRARTEKLSLVYHANGTTPTDYVNDIFRYGKVFESTFVIKPPFLEKV